MTKLVLIGDVGGTNLRFQFVAADAVPGLVPEPLLAVRHKTRDFGCLEDSLALVMQQLETAMPGAALLAAGFSVCGPITETTGGASSAICLALVDECKPRCLKLHRLEPARLVVGKLEALEVLQFAPAAVVVSAVVVVGVVVAGAFSGEVSSVLSVAAECFSGRLSTLRQRRSDRDLSKGI